MNLAVIPARGGSKRIPRKNIKNFLGKPIIAYSIETALQSGLFAEVMVSTDDDEIAKIAKQYGAKVPFMRSAAAASDHATTADVIFEVIAGYEKRDEFFENVCCIYPCSPFVTSKDLNESYTQLLEKQFDTVVPVIVFAPPIQRALKVKNGFLRFLYPEHIVTRSQDLEESFHDAGQYYWIKTATFRTQKRLFTDNSGAVIVSELEAQDIDNETDWKMAELKYKLLFKKNTDG